MYVEIQIRMRIPIRFRFKQMVALCYKNYKTHVWQISLPSMLVFVLLWSQAMATFTIFYRSLLFIVEAKVGRENKRRKIGYVNEQPFLTDRGCHIQRISLVVACCMPDNDMGTMCID